jgi:hypothetical protein
MRFTQGASVDVCGRIEENSKVQRRQLVTMTSRLWEKVGKNNDCPKSAAELGCKMGKNHSQLIRACHNAPLLLQETQPLLLGLWIGKCLASQKR